MVIAISYALVGTLIAWWLEPFEEGNDSMNICAFIMTIVLWPILSLVMMILWITRRLKHVV